MKISLIIPVYNEEAAIPIFYQAIKNAEFLKPYQMELVFINDGSKDQTENLINMLHIL
ncbi:glycosyltransferase [Wohlfahrtiimonas populi]|uniref:glycosyltransferase n=1 Tax=Wohlfahrtiimonas populi TaxID=1940240 RepID=UPI00098D15EA